VESLGSFGEKSLMAEVITVLKPTYAQVVSISEEMVRDWLWEGTLVS
jgi:hypothetical protein